MVCVPITVEDIDHALTDATLAAAKGADLVEWRIDSFFPGSEGDTEDAYRVKQLQRLLAESPLPCVLTCRSASEGGDYDGDDADRVSLLEKLTAACETPPAYLDVELATYQRSANLRQKINLCVDHPAQTRDVPTRLILSIHDFQGPPADLSRRLLAAYQEPACAVVKVAYRARSLRDNLDLFDIMRESPKPIIALGMGEFGLMSRVLAPKFNGLLTFAALRDESATAPGQPTISELLYRFRFRSIGPATRVYGVIGWPVGHSLSPLIHNAGFEHVGHDGVYLPLPIAADSKDPEASETSFRATVGALVAYDGLGLSGASVTLPHKEHAAHWNDSNTRSTSIADEVQALGAANTLVCGSDLDGSESGAIGVYNTDSSAIEQLLGEALRHVDAPHIGVIGNGGVARAAAYAAARAGGAVVIFGRSIEKARGVAKELNARSGPAATGRIEITAASLDEIDSVCCHAYINCTPLGMAGGPSPKELSIPVSKLTKVEPETVFFDTVYNPVETPMLREAKRLGYHTIDGVEMFVKQAASQFQLWTNREAPVDLFDKLCREALADASPEEAAG